MAVEVEIHLVGAEPVLPLPPQHVFEDDLPLEFGLITAGEIDVFDFLGDVSLFVGQEGVIVPAPADERFFLEPAEARFNTAAQAEPIAVDLIEAKRHEVVHVPLHLVDIPDQEENLQQADVEGFQAGVRCGLVDRLLHGRIEKALDGRVKVVQRHQDADRVDRHCLCR